MNHIRSIHLSKIHIGSHIWHEYWLLERTPLIHRHRVHHIHIHHWCLSHAWHLHKVLEWSVWIKSCWCIINWHKDVVKLNVGFVRLVFLCGRMNLSQSCSFLAFFRRVLFGRIRFLFVFALLLNQFLKIFWELCVDISFVLNVLIIKVFKTCIVWILSLLSLLSEVGWTILIILLRILLIRLLRKLWSLSSLWGHLRWYLLLSSLICIHIWHMSLSQL